jgi:hypothetical protein
VWSACAAAPPKAAPDFTHGAHVLTLRAPYAMRRNGA